MSDLNGSHADSGYAGVRRTLRLAHNVIFTLELCPPWTAHIWECVSETLTACAVFVRGMTATRQEGRGDKCVEKNSENLGCNLQLW